MPHADNQTDSQGDAHESTEQSVAFRLLMRLVNVRQGEVAALLASATYFFLVLSSYYLIKPFRDAMGIARGAEKLPWLMTGTMLAMLAVAPAYAAIASRFPRRVFIPLAYRFLAANIIGFYLLFRLMPEPWQPAIERSYYIWVSVFNLFVTSIFWSVMADRFAVDQGKRLFGFIGVGGTIGAIVGASVTKALVEGVHFGQHTFVLQPATMLLCSIVPLELAVHLARWLTRAAKTTPTRGEVPSKSREPSPSMMEGFWLLVDSPYLAMIALYVLIFSFTSTPLQLQLSQMIEHAFPDKSSRTAAFARLDVWTNAITLFVQLLLTARIIRLIGVGATMALVPTITLLGFALLLVHPTLVVVSVFQVVRRAMHYAVDRPARETLYTVVGPDAKYKTKNFIDTFVYRSGDQIGAWTPSLLAKVNVPVGALAVPLAVIWIALALVLGVLQRRKIVEPA